MSGSKIVTAESECAGGEKSLRYMLPMTLDAVDQMGEQLANDLESLGYDVMHVMKTELLFEEFCSNAILHDHSVNQQEKEFICCIVDCGQEAIEMTLSMPGDFFDLPAELKLLDPEKILEEQNNALQSDGRGLPIIKKCLSRIDYSRTDRVNKFSFTIKRGDL